MSSFHPPYGEMPTQSCRNCRAQLPPAETYCKYCSYQNAVIQNNPGFVPPSSPPRGNTFSRPLPDEGQSGQWGRQPASYSPSLQVGAQTPYGFPASSAPPYPGPFANGGNKHISLDTPFSLTSGHDGVPSATGQLPNNGYPLFLAQPVAYMPDASYANSTIPAGRVAQPKQEQPARRKLHLGRVLLLLLLVIGLVGGGSLSYNLLKPNPRPPVVRTPVISSFSIPKATPIFADAFATNTNGWYLRNEPGKVSSSVGNGSLALEDDDHTMIWALVPSTKSFSDFTLLVDAALIKGDANCGYGFFIRGATDQNGSWSSFYRVSLYGDGTFSILKGSVNQNGQPITAKLVDYTANTVIQRVGGTNHVSIVANGSTIRFGVNEQPLTTITDSSYENGSIAFFVVNLKNAQVGTQVKFSKLGIYPAGF